MFHHDALAKFLGHQDKGHYQKDYILHSLHNLQFKTVKIDQTMKVKEGRVSHNQTLVKIVPKHLFQVHFL